MQKPAWFVILVLLVGALLGHLVGQAAGWQPLLVAANLGMPAQEINLLVVKLTLGLQFHFTLAAAIGLTAALILILRR